MRAWRRHRGTLGRLGAIALVVNTIGVAAARTTTSGPGADPLAALRKTLAARAPDARAVLILRGGCAAFAFYKPGTDADTRLPLHSMTKSVLSALVGRAIERGVLTLDETLGRLLPEALDPALDPRVRSITVRQLLTMTAGWDAEAKPIALPPPEAWRWALARPILSAPGSAFRYDNQNANLLSVILSRRLGQSAEALAREALFGPMDVGSFTWLADPDGHSVGAYGLWLTAPDMAKIGLLYLHAGRWAGRQLVPESFARASTRVQNPGGTPFRAAYGYLWWVRPTKAGPDAFFAAGSDGQAIYVVPKRDLVVVLASDKTPPGGAVGFLTDVILPVATALPARSCVGASAAP